MNKYDLTLWTDEMVYTRSAVYQQYDCYCKEWRKTFIERGAGIAMIYLPAINNLRRVFEQIDELIPHL